jgi:2-(1,2-epoxy-1,2-dihydrophenyl)acetyl-CoA isomerase
MQGLELETVELRLQERVAWITLNRPEALNAWTPQLAREMIAALDHAAASFDIGAVVIAGAGRGFSSGTDLMHPGLLPEAGTKPDVLTLLRDEYNPLITRVRTLPKPVIAAVHGGAVGIGCALALAADLVIAAKSAYFLLAFANIGLALDGGASALLVGRVGHGRASELALLADRIGAEQALGWGLANRVVADDQLLPAAGELAARLAAGPTGAYATIKRTLNAAAYPRLAEILELEATLQQERAESEDFLEGVQAFLQKRPAKFTGN